MRHNKKGRTLGRTKAPREAMLRNLAQSLILYENVNTTLAKAKEIRPVVEKLITTSKKKSLVSRRKLAASLSMESAVNKMLEEIGPRYAARKGGYTRIIKLGRRQGDGAEIAQIQLIRDASAGPAEQAVETAPVETKAKKSPAAKQKAKSE